LDIADAVTRNYRLEGTHFPVPMLTNQSQEAPQCDKTSFLTIQPSIDVTGKRNERWQ